MLDSSTRVAAVTGSGLIDLHLHGVVDHAGCINCAHDLACITSMCDVEQLYTDAALVLDTSTRVAAAAAFMLDASTRVAATSESLIDLHLHGVVELTPPEGAVQSSERGQHWPRGCTEPSPPPASIE